MSIICQSGPFAVEGNPALAEWEESCNLVQATSGCWSTCLQLVCSFSYCLCLPYLSVLSGAFKIFACHFTICFFRCCCERVTEIREEVQDPVCTEASHTVLGFYCVGTCTLYFSPSFSLSNFKVAVSFQCTNRSQNHFGRNGFRNNHRFQNFHVHYAVV